LSKTRLVAEQDDRLLLLALAENHRPGVFQPEQGGLLVEVIGGKAALLKGQTQPTEQVTDRARSIVDAKAVLIPAVQHAEEYPAASGPARTSVLSSWRREVVSFGGRPSRGW
jgi:hypothetical protein